MSAATRHKHNMKVKRSWLPCTAYKASIESGFLIFCLDEKWTALLAFCWRPRESGYIVRKRLNAARSTCNTHRKFRLEYRHRRSVSLSLGYWSNRRRPSSLPLRWCHCAMWTLAGRHRIEGRTGKRTLPNTNFVHYKNKVKLNYKIK